MKNGWQLKPLHKQIMLSAAYRQSHEVSAENLRIDPDNRYLWHYKPRRLDAEIIRDALLAVGGNLDAKMFGPSILAETPRRSIYLRVKRSELIPLMTIFDAPEPTQSIGERISTTVPTQALALMNSPLVRQQAEKLAQRIRGTKDSPPRGGRSIWPIGSPSPGFPAIRNEAKCWPSLPSSGRLPRATRR